MFSIVFKVVINTKEKIIFYIFNIKITIDKNRLSNRVLKKNNAIYENENKISLKPNIIPKEQTLDVLLETEKSICRYGDGEFTIIGGYGIGFQEYDCYLANRLKEILKNKREDLLVGIPNIFGSLNKYDKDGQNYWRKYLYENREKIYEYLDMDKQYYDAFISRPYFIFKNKICDDYFHKIKKLWENKDILIVEGRFSRLGYKNNLFDNVSSIKRILCPEQNAWNKYREIIRCCQGISKEKLFIIALGPTATVLAHDLSNLGYRALDLGHIDIEYEWFLRKAKTKTVIKDKYVNENFKGTRVNTNVTKEFQHEILYDLS